MPGRVFTAASSMYLSNANAIGGTYPFSFACFYYCTDATANRCLMAVTTGTASDNQSHSMRLNSSGGVASTVDCRSRTTSDAQAVTTANWTVNTLQHACATFAAGNARAIYLNGTNKGTNTTNRTPSGMTSTHVGRYASTTQYMDGDIFIPCIWNVSLTDTEVTALANGAWPQSIRPANIIGFWPLGYSSPEVDVSGQNRAMTLNAAPTISTKGPPKPQLPFSFDLWKVPTGFTPAAVTLRMLAASGVGK